MSTSNGQPCSATVLNNAYGSKTADNTFTGIQELDRVGSGATVLDTQQAINDLIADVASVESDITNIQADIVTLQSDVAALHNTKVEYRTISAGEFAAKQLTLSLTPFVAGEVAFDISGGTSQFYGDDFTVSGAVVDWTGLALDGVLVAGDKVRFIYQY